jgi:hypothetical protein
VEVVIGLLVFGFLVLISSRHPSTEGPKSRWLADPARTAGVILLVSSTGFLIALDVPWWSSNTSYLSPTPAVVDLQRAVGTSIVGFGSTSCLDPPTLGIPANVNIVYGIHELDSYDPLTPGRLFRSWSHATKTYPRPTGVHSRGIPISMFCPVVKTAASARLFGVGFVLEFKKTKPPTGSVFVSRIGGESLFRIPGVSVATLTPLTRLHGLPSVKAPGAPVPVTYPTPTSWKVETNASSDQVLRLRLIDVPGWHASIDGRPLPLVQFAGAMFQAKIPAGRHTIELHYWPDTFNAGIVIAACTAIITLVALLVVVTRRRAREPDSQ